MRPIVALLLAAVMAGAVSAQQKPSRPKPPLPRKDKLPADKSDVFDPITQLLDWIAGPQTRPRPQGKFNPSLRYREFPQLSAEEMKAELDSRLKLSAERDILSQWGPRIKAMMAEKEKDRPSPEAIRKMAEPFYEQLRNKKELMEIPKVRELADQLEATLKGKVPAGDMSLPHSGEHGLPHSGEHELPRPNVEPGARPMDLGLPDAAGLWSTPTPQDEEMMRLFKRFAENAESSGLGKYLMESPAFQELKQNLYDPRLAQQQPAALPFSGAVGKLGDATRGLWRPDWSWRPNLSNLTLSNLAGWRPPTLAMPNLRFSAPSVGAPSLPSGPAADFQALAWLVLGVLAIGLLWMWSRSASRRRVAAAEVVLGPWPIAPDKVSTRRQLMLAFDHLAQLRLGHQAVYWNHRTIAHHLGCSADRHDQAARRLADVYEAVRYTESPQSLDADLGPQERDAARRDLCLLAAGL